MKKLKKQRTLKSEMLQRWEELVDLYNKVKSNSSLSLVCNLILGFFKLIITIKAREFWEHFFKE